MVDILGIVFKQFSSQLHVSSNIKVSSLENGVLVIGDENINRSLLFLAAVTAASELGVKVLFFTRSQIQSLPVTFQGSASSGLKPDYLKKIRFVYPKTLEDLLDDVASLHELVVEAAALPSLVIVDGLERYICGPAAQNRPQQETQNAAAHVVALLHDTAAFLTRNLEARSGNEAQCRVIVSIQPEWKGVGGCDLLTSDPLLLVLERYLQVRCTSEKLRMGEEPNKWLLCLSGPGLQVDGDNNAEEQLRWHVVLQPNGALEFCPVSPEQGETPQGQNPVEVNNETQRV
ncbi:ATPase SWSAP1 [Colossoma macropomum]|uniref:ATPase SWSAP1 n=1 Tax=Colossoma macropomum TaxID=42526 RepID=UPI001863ECD0|nr:ATPase SWSAP1 [Colossoma macropomum]